MCLICKNLNEPFTTQACMLGNLIHWKAAKTEWAFFHVLEKKNIVKT